MHPGTGAGRSAHAQKSSWGHVCSTEQPCVRTLVLVSRLAARRRPSRPKTVPAHWLTPNFTRRNRLWTALATGHPRRGTGTVAVLTPVLSAQDTPVPRET